MAYRRKSTCSGISTTTGFWTLAGSRRNCYLFRLRIHRRDRTGHPAPLPLLAVALVLLRPVPRSVMMMTATASMDFWVAGHVAADKSAVAHCDVLKRNRRRVLQILLAGRNSQVACLLIPPSRQQQSPNPISR